MKIRNVAIKDGKVEVLPSHADLEELSINSYNRIYVGLNEYSELYLLKRNRHTHRYEWLALWNSDTWTSINKNSDFATMESALSVALENGWIVQQLGYDYFKHLIEGMKCLPK